MDKIILAIFDLSGIQRFIFSTNKMKEMIGASAVVHNALFYELPKALGVDSGEWKSGDFTFSDDDAAKIVYIGGGNALVAFDSMERYSGIARELAKSVFLNSGGAIRLTSAAITLDINADLSENQKRLMAELDKVKKAGGSSTPATVLPVVAYDNNNYEPLVLTENRRQAMPLSRMAKQNAANANMIFADIKPSSEVVFSGDMEDSREQDRKNYQAIIHIDGNTMGIKIREFVTRLTGDIQSQLTAMRKLSIAISSCYRSTLRETIGSVFGESGKLDFRPIVADGDDITVVTSADKAFNFTESFIRNLESKTILFGNEEFRPTAAAGIAFVTLKFPFSIAYALAEACCKNAKRVTIDRCGGPDAFLKNPVSSVDYQVCYSNISDNLEIYRKKYFNRDDHTLLKRPYMFTADGDYSFSEFWEMCNSFNLAVKQGKIARSKLKGLRNAYGVGRMEAEDYAHFILSHVKHECERPVATLLSAPFDSNHEAKFFDYLDIMDIAWKEAIDK